MYRYRDEIQQSSKFSTKVLVLRKKMTRADSFWMSHSKFAYDSAGVVLSEISTGTQPVQAFKVVPTVDTTYF